jgi:hypothetical protein
VIERMGNKRGYVVRRSDGKIIGEYTDRRDAIAAWKKYLLRLDKIRRAAQRREIRARDTQG